VCHSKYFTTSQVRSHKSCYRHRLWGILLRLRCITVRVFTCLQHNTAVHFCSFLPLSLTPERSTARRGLWVEIDCVSNGISNPFQVPCDQSVSGRCCVTDRQTGGTIGDINCATWVLTGDEVQSCNYANVWCSYGLGFVSCWIFSFCVKWSWLCTRREGT